MVQSYTDKGSICGIGFHGTEEKERDLTRFFGRSSHEALQLPLNNNNVCHPEEGRICMCGGNFQKILRLHSAKGIPLPLNDKECGCHADEGSICAGGFS
jgi:hypothetical protein